MYIEDYNLLFEVWMKASHAYYVRDDPVMPDAEWDSLGDKLEDNWLSITHPDKTLVLHESDDAPTFSTGYYLQFKYPEWAGDG